MIALVALLFALQIGDWLTTRRILALGGVEKNPIIRKLISAVGSHLALLIKTVAVMAIGLALTFLPWPFLAVLCAMYAWVVWSNWRVLGRLLK